jgi:hypothetical protein
MGTDILDTHYRVLVCIKRYIHLLTTGLSQDKIKKVYPIGCFDQEGRIKTNKSLFIKKNTVITFVFPVTPIGCLDYCDLFKVSVYIYNEYIYNELFILGCFSLGIIVINILSMNNDHIPSNVSQTHRVGNERNHSNNELSSRLIAQLMANNANNRNKRNYINFPSDHPGHLNLERQIRLVEIIRSSSLADEYRFGSTLGKIYVKNTYRHPIISVDVIGLVLYAESVSR